MTTDEDEDEDEELFPYEVQVMYRIYNRFFLKYQYFYNKTERTALYIEDITDQDEKDYWLAMLKEQYTYLIHYWNRLVRFSNIISELLKLYNIERPVITF